MANMLSNTKLWCAVAGVSTASALYLGKALPFRSPFDLSQPGAIWRMLAIVLALLNLKSLPFAWHIRVFHGLLRHVLFLRAKLPSKAGPAVLFQPVITSTHSPLLECDYNMHKSNSTYFSDLDVSRMHHLACLMKLGLGKAREAVLAERKGRFAIMLGGVACSFRKEVLPYERFEIWTRVLSWDRKWLYLASHVVRKGVVKPEAYMLQPWKKGVDKEGAAARATKMQDAILATSVSKYVFKQGRRTIPPEMMLQIGGFLPPKSAPNGTPVVDEDATGQSTPAGLDTVATLVKYSSSSLDSLFGHSAHPGLVEEWDWNRVEAERLKGMRIAEHLAGLDGLHGEFTGEDRPALGQF